MKNKQKARRRCAWILSVLLCILAILPVLFVPASAEHITQFPDDFYGEFVWVTPTEDYWTSDDYKIGTFNFQYFTIPQGSFFTDGHAFYATYCDVIVRYYEDGEYRYVHAEDGDVTLWFDPVGLEFKIYSKQGSTYRLLVRWESGDYGFRIGADDHFVQSFDFYVVYGSGQYDFLCALMYLGATCPGIPSAEGGYKSGYTAGKQAGEDLHADDYQNGYDAGNANADQQYVEGYKSGKADGEAAHADDYRNGFAAGQTDAMNSTSSLKDMIFSIFSAPADLINGILDFDLFGINLATLVKTLITLAVTALIVVFLIKFMRR